MEIREMMDRLSEPFDPRDVKFKPQSVKGNRALAVAFIDVRSVTTRLDDVFGIAGWQDSYDVLPNDSVMCRLAIWIDGVPSDVDGSGPKGGRWVTKQDVGSPSEQPDGGDRMKAAVSDALKRCAVKLGVGKYLYRLPLIWADYDPQKRQFTAPPQLPHWALPKPKGQSRPQPASQPAPQPTVVEKPGGGGQAANGGSAGDGRPLAERQQMVYEEFLMSLNKAESESEVFGIGGLIKAKMLSDQNAMDGSQLQKLRDQMAESLEFFRNQGEGGGDSEDAGPY